MSQEQPTNGWDALITLGAFALIGFLFWVYFAWGKG